MSPGRQLGLLWGAVAAILVLLSPFAATLAAAFPACPLLNLTGLPCPGCGSARAAVALAQWHPWEAWRWNPLATLGWVFLVTGGVAGGVGALTGRELPPLPRRLPVAGRLAVVLAVAANWVYLIGFGRVGSGYG